MFIKLKMWLWKIWQVIFIPQVHICFIHIAWQSLASNKTNLITNETFPPVEELTFLHDNRFSPKISFLHSTFENMNIMLISTTSIDLHHNVLIPYRCDFTNYPCDHCSRCCEQWLVSTCTIYCLSKSYVQIQ